jgi:hypothetical protein
MIAVDFARHIEEFEALVRGIGVQEYLDPSRHREAFAELAESLGDPHLVDVEVADAIRNAEREKGIAWGASLEGPRA